jgi:uncharacterized protein (TIGR02145 family)
VFDFKKYSYICGGVERKTAMTMRKLLLLFTILILGLAACSARNVPTQPSSQVEEGIVINGIRWATRNVDTPGVFVAHPENFGRLYQWNRRQSWGTAGEVLGWDSSVPSNVWSTYNDPCPQGWRVPTQAEFIALGSSIWTIQNGVRGRLYGTAPYQIFLPAAGFRNRIGALNSIGTDGFYWSSTPMSGENARSLWFSSGYSDVGHNYRVYGFSVRCVAE